MSVVCKTPAWRFLGRRQRVWLIVRTIVAIIILFAFFTTVQPVSARALSERFLSPTSGTPVFLPDGDGENDIDSSSQSNQADLSALAIGLNQYGWKWDEAFLSGGNSQNVCIYLSTDGADGTAERAICYEVVSGGDNGSGGFTIASETVATYVCPAGTYSTNAAPGGQKCTGNPPLATDIAASCVLTPNVTSQFGTDPDVDTQVLCGYSTTLSLTLVNICSKTGSDPASSSKDCGLATAPAFLKLLKVVNGGSATPADFTLRYNGPDGNDGAVPGDYGQFIPLTPGVYTLTESGPLGYVRDTLVCSNNDNDGTLTLAANNEVTCTFTNRKVNPAYTISKTPELQVVQSGAPVTFTLRLENTGDVPLTNVTVSDANTPACNRTFTTLAVGEIQAYDCQLAAVPATFVNIATASSDQTLPISDTATVQVADLLISKSAQPTTLPEPGGFVTFTVDIINTSSTTLTLHTLMDNPYGNITQRTGTIASTDCVTPQRLAPAGNLQGFRYTCSFMVLVDGEPGDYVDTVTASLTDRYGNQIQIADAATVTMLDVKPTVSLQKSVTPARRLEPGGVFVYTLTVTNIAAEPVTITALSDSQQQLSSDFSQCAALVGQSLVPNASRSCQYAVVQTEAGTYTNTATVRVRDNESNPATATDNASVTVDDALPTVSLTKIVSPTSRLEPGGAFAYTLTVTNTAVEPVTITNLVDTLSASAIDFTECTTLIGQSLAPNASRSCHYLVIHSDTGAYTNTATVTVEDNEAHAASNQDSVTVNVIDVLPSVTLVKAPNPARLAEPGGLFTFTLTVTNTSVEPVVITALTDSQAAQATGFAQCTALVGQTLASNASRSCQYTVSHTDSGSYANAASVTVEDNEKNSASDNVDVAVVVGNTLPSVLLTKRATPTTLTEPGGTFVFTLTVTNSSVEPVTIIALADDQSALALDFSQCAALVGQVLAVNETRTCQYAVPQTEAGTYVNTATVMVRDNEANDASAKDEVTVAVNDALPLVTLHKTAAPIRLDEPGGAFLFTLTVTNNSVETVTITALQDNQATLALDFGQCAALIGQPLAPAQSRACQYTVAHTNAGVYINVASVTVTDNEANVVSDQAESTTAVNDSLPLLHIIKSAQPESVLATGDNVLFLFEFFNDGIEPLTLTTLVDSLFGNLAGMGDCTVPQTVAVNGVYRCRVTQVISGQFGNDHHNVVTATAQDDEGNTATASDDATVHFIEVQPNIQTLKTARLQIDADNDGRVSPGDTLRYTISILNTGNGLASNSFLTDAPDPQTSLVVGSVVASKGQVTAGNNAGDTTVEVEIGDLLPNAAERVQVRFDVVIDPQITVPLIRNQAVVAVISGQSGPSEEHLSDDPTTPKVDDETITEVFAPTAEEPTAEPSNRRLFLPLINR